jgi:hypothetical protein
LTLTFVIVGACVACNAPDDDSTAQPTRSPAPAIRKALAQADPGDEVYLPAGVFDLDSADPDRDEVNIPLFSGVRLRDAGPGRTVLVTSVDDDDDSAVVSGRGRA